jgi:hypothetical protein
MRGLHDAERCKNREQGRGDSMLHAKLSRTRRRNIRMRHRQEHSGYGRTILGWLVTTLILAMIAGVPGSALAKGQIEGGITSGNGIASLTRVVKPSAPGAARQQSASTGTTFQWYDGTSKYQLGTNCINGTPENMITSSVGFYGTNDFSYPKVGDVYYAHVVFRSGNQCGGVVVSAGIFLPPGTGFAVSTQNPVRCYYNPGNGWIDGTNDPGTDCRHNPNSLLPDGSWDLGTRTLGAYWMFEIQVPVYSTKELKGASGPNGGDVFAGHLESWTVSPRTAYPQAWAVVPSNPPTFHNESSTNITATGARTRGDVQNNYQAGNAYFDLGMTTSYGTVAGPMPMSASNSYYAGNSTDWGGLTPNTTYHWRLRFVDSNGVAYYGTDQTFTTTASSDTTPPAGTVTINSGGAYTNKPTVSVAVPATDNSGTISQVRLSNDGASWYTTTYSTPKSWSLSNTSYGGSTTNGARTVYAQWQDPAGNWSTTSADTIVLDTVVPTTPGVPVQSFPPTYQLSATAIPVKLTWTGSTDSTSGIARYELQQSNDGGATWTSVARPPTTSTIRMLAPGTTAYSFRVRAQDRAGNFSPYRAASSFTLSAYQETSSGISYAGSWTGAVATGAYGGSVKYSRAAGAKARFTFTGSRMAWISAMNTDRGIAEVYDVDPVSGAATKVGTVDLYAGSYKPARVVFARAWSSGGTHVIEVRVLGTKNVSSTDTRVDVDAFVTTR